MNKKQKPKRKKSITLHPRGRTWIASFASEPHAQDVTGSTCLTAPATLYIVPRDSRIITNSHSFIKNDKNAIKQNDSWINATKFVTKDWDNINICCTVCCCVERVISEADAEIWALCYLVIPTYQRTYTVRARKTMIIETKAIKSITCTSIKM